LGSPDLQAELSDDGETFYILYDRTLYTTDGKNTSTNDTRPEVDAFCLNEDVLVVVFNSTSLLVNGTPQNITLPENTVGISYDDSPLGELVALRSTNTTTMYVIQPNGNNFVCASRIEGDVSIEPNFDTVQSGAGASVVISEDGTLSGVHLITSSRPTADLDVTKAVAMKSRCDAWILWMCSTDSTCVVPYLEANQTFNQIFSRRGLETTKQKVLSKQVQLDDYNEMEATCNQIYGGARRMAWGDGTEQECLNTTYSSSGRQINPTSVETQGTDIITTFTLNVTTGTYRALVGVSQGTSSGPWNASQAWSGYVQEPEECVVVLNQSSTPSDNATATIPMTCYEGDDASMYIVVFECGSDDVLTRHLGKVTLKRFLRGTLSHSFITIEDFDVTIYSMDVVVDADFVEKMYLGVMNDEQNPVEMFANTLTASASDWWNHDGRYRVVASLSATDCAKLDIEREYASTINVDNEMVYVNASGGDWKSYCNGTWEQTPESVYYPLTFDGTFENQSAWCYCVLEEIEASVWEAGTDYEVNLTVVDGVTMRFRINTTEVAGRRLSVTEEPEFLSGRTVEGVFTVDRRLHSTTNDDYDELRSLTVASLIWNGLMTVALIGMFVFLYWCGCKMCRRKGEEKVSVSAKVDAPAKIGSYVRLRPPSSIGSKVE